MYRPDKGRGGKTGCTDEGGNRTDPGRESVLAMLKRRRNRVNSQPPPKDVAKALYNTFYASTFRQVLAVTGDEDLAIEATQEAFVRAFERNLLLSATGTVSADEVIAFIKSMQLYPGGR